MAVLLAIPFLGGLLVLQSAVFSRIPLLQGTVDLVLLAVIAWALQKRVQTAWHWGVIGGLMVSFVSALPYGLPLVYFLLSVGLALALRQRVWQVPFLAMLVATFFSILIAHLLVVVSLRVLGTSLPLLETLNLITLPSLLYNLLLAVPIYAIIRDMANWLYPEELEM